MREVTDHFARLWFELEYAERGVCFITSEVPISFAKFKPKPSLWVPLFRKGLTTVYGVDFYCTFYRMVWLAQ
jgi:hypothetical protein